MKYSIKKFDELTNNELYEILRLRNEVFIIEQNCLYQDLDLKDKGSYHLFVEKNDTIIAYLRIIPKGISYKEVSIGRVVTKLEYRNQGIAKEMLKKAIEFIKLELNEQKVRISAQVYAEKLYKSVGFKQISNIYLEDNIKHIEMLYE